MLNSHYFYYMVLRTHCLLKNALLSDKFDLRSLDKLTEIGDKFSKFHALTFDLAIFKLVDFESKAPGKNFPKP